MNREGGERNCKKIAVLHNLLHWKRHKQEETTEERVRSRSKRYGKWEVQTPMSPHPHCPLIYQGFSTIVYISSKEANDSSIAYKIILSSIPQHIPECAWWSNPVEVMTSTQLLINDYSIINKSHHNISYNHN